VLVLRHENEISGTTDVAAHPEFAGRRTTKVIDGTSHTGWFTEDFTWAELATLRASERLPRVRQASTTFDGSAPILRLRDLLELLGDGPVQLVAEIKHATYFASIGLPLDELFAAEIAGFAARERLIVESFEQTVLEQIRDRGVPARYVFLLEAAGSPPDLVARYGRKALPYSAHLTDAGLARLARQVDGISVDKTLLLRPGTDLVQRAHAAGLTVYVWTLRAENAFLAESFRRGSSPRDFGDWRSEFQLILDTGVDGVFADQPDLVFAALRG
jgi:glycerophosphoryl diester phosphodiesterase